MFKFSKFLNLMVYLWDRLMIFSSFIAMNLRSFRCLNTTIYETSCWSEKMLFACYCSILEKYSNGVLAKIFEIQLSIEEWKCSAV